MKFSFHRSPETGAAPNAIVVFQAEGQPATPEQIDGLLQLLNMPEHLAVAAAPYVPGEADEFLKPTSADKKEV